ncbi:hypothetical protein TA3x_000042 [Tundrisphaera sp. TA3]|uniref:hypothetical protein n=1 Tax=Tundrisphaera sp. TA3 TaxID=3435775 RepID=UPI003EB6EDC7
MTTWPAVAMLLCVADAPKSDPEADRARRAEIIARVMAEPLPPQFRPANLLTYEEYAAPDEAVVGEFIEDELAGGFARRRVDVPPGPAKRRLALAPDCYDRWIFGSKVDPASRREWLNHRLDVRIGWAARARQLTPAESEKIRLAGSGDIKRFLDLAESMRGEFDAVRLNEDAGRQYLNNRLSPIRVLFQEGPFGEDSLYAKALRKVEDDRK